MFVRRTLAVFTALMLGVTLSFHGQDTPSSRGRKYRPPPDVSHIEVMVIKGSNKKPIANAAVIFHPVKDGREEGNLEVKTDPDGKAVIDVIPTGSLVTVQVIADGFATFAEDYDVKEASRSILVKMIRPRAQISAYEDNSGKASDRKVGVQEPAKPSTPSTTTPPTPAAGKPSDPTAPTTVAPAPSSK
jgi:hypothetical protein